MESILKETYPLDFGSLRGGLVFTAANHKNEKRLFPFMLGNKRDLRLTDSVGEDNLSPQWTVNEVRKGVFTIRCLSTAED
eukprot:2755538-Amphidinium_carterae.1